MWEVSAICVFDSSRYGSKLNHRLYVVLAFLVVMLVVSPVVPSFSLTTHPNTTPATRCEVGPAPSLTSAGTYTDYPISISYQNYTFVSYETRTFATPSIPAGSAAISVGAYNGVLSIQVTQSGTQILSTTITGGSFYEDENYVVVHGATSYCYVNFNSNGQGLNISVSAVSGEPLVAYNVYNNYISADTAVLITYPRQFYANIVPNSTPVNTGLSFLVVAPTYSEPTPLAIWVGEGSGDPTTGQQWWAQVGFVTWTGNFDASYAFMEMFSNIPSVEHCNTCDTSGPIISNYKLIPGDTYNFTMALVSGTTWEFSINGTAMQGKNFKGFYDTTTSDSNDGMGVSVGGEVLGLETLSSWGGNVRITNPIIIPVMSSFRVNGRWSEPNSFAFSNVGENWGAGQVTSSPGIDLWGIAAHSQKASVPCGALLFNQSLPTIMQTSQSTSEPLYSCLSSVTAVTLNPSAGSVGSPIVFAVAVAPAESGTAPSGRVAWSVNGSGIGSCVLSSSGSCTISYTPTTPDQYVVSAVYLGDSNYAGSSGASTFTVVAVS